MSGPRCLVHILCDWTRRHDRWVGGALIPTWADGMMVSSTTFVATSYGPAVAANVALPQANVASPSLTERFLPRTDVSYNGTGA